MASTGAAPDADGASLDVSAVMAKKELVAPLLEAGACARCVMRLAAVDVDELLWQPEARVHRALAAASGISVTESDRAPCSVCLGALARLHDPAIEPCAASDAIVDTLKQSGYEMGDYKLETFLPGACTIRESLMLRHLERATGASMAEHRIIPLKDYHKNLIERSLSRQLPSSPMRGASSLVLCLRYTHPETDEDFRDLPVPADPIAHRRKRKRRDGGVTEGGVLYVSRALNLVEQGETTPRLAIPPRRVVEAVGVEVSPYREPIYLAAEYLKLDRSLSQTPWFIDGVKRTETSVEELLTGPLHRLVGGCRASKFHSAGREDVDVRMLGDGRPCLLEMEDAKRDTLAHEELARAQEEVNQSAVDRVEIRNLRQAGKDAVVALARGADSKRKTYTCVVWTSKAQSAATLAALAQVRDLKVKQRTPLRVLHRRTLLTRDKVIHAIRVEPLAPHYFILHLTTSAGTYVKEFVHGDTGRTTPNLGDLLACEADILQLDVTGLVQGTE